MSNECLCGSRSISVSILLLMANLPWLVLHCLLPLQVTGLIPSLFLMVTVHEALLLLLGALLLPLGVVYSEALVLLMEHVRPLKQIQNRKFLLILRMMR